MANIKGKAWKEKLKTDIEFAFANKKNHTLHAYIDISGGLVEGTLLTQILYWCGNSKDESADKLKVFRDGEYWLAKGRESWWEEIRITPRQFDTAVKNLKKKNLIDTARFHFGGVPTIHVRPMYDEINNAIDKWKENYKKVIEEENGKEKYVRVNSNLQNCKLTDCENDNLQNEEMEITDLQNANNNNINNNIDIDTEITNRDYNTENTLNSFSNEKDNSKPNGLDLHNSQVGELGTPTLEPQKDISPKTKSNVTRTFGVIKHEPKQHELKDMPTRVREIAYELSEDEMLSDKAYDFMECFLEYYKAYRHKEHPNLTNPVLKRAVNDMLSGMTQHIEPKDGEPFDNDYYPLICHEVDRKDFEEVIKQYFQTKFTQKTDYGICHFLDENVLPKIMNKCMLNGDHWYESHELY